MRHLLTLLLLVIPAAALGQYNGSIGVFSDFSQNCGIRDEAGERTVYVIQRFSIGHLSSRFRVEPSDGLTASLVSFATPLAGVSGHPLTGVTIDYGTCQSGSYLVLELSMLFLGTSPPCSWLRIQAHPDSPDGELEVYDCDGNRQIAAWEGLHVDPNRGIGCPGGECQHLICPTCRPGEPTVPVAETTWGRIKSLYQ